MRFFANGPDLPNELLDQRDNGNVVFFCGAGVSRPAGLPGFFELAKRTIAALGAPPGAKSRALLERADAHPDFAVPLDQVFTLLQREYGAIVIDDTVRELLKPPRDASIEQHSIILRLSRNAAREPQVVTTNFDPLFERADKSLVRYVPPMLPDLASGQPLRGLVYLHGRCASNTASSAARQGLVISSSDFGRAYLADGWATRFVRDLMRNYTIVLLGYSATDPPVRYLLEGLHARDGGPSAKIYAFDQGTAAEVHDRWRDRGVIPLAYPESGPLHSALWDTLRAWAARADDPESWRRSVIDRARAGPTALQPHERGQVASVVRTTDGANAFADANPPPPADWLCVFDPRVRYEKPRSPIGAEDVDPLSLYGLDNDPPRPAEQRATDALGEDFLRVLPDDERSDLWKRLAGMGRRWPDPVPPRLFHLARWLGKVMNEPAAIWWAAGYGVFHPVVVDQLSWRLREPEEEGRSNARRIWALMLEQLGAAERELRWFEVARSIKSVGWSNAAFREVERLAQPALKWKRPWQIGPQPPSGGWDGLEVAHIIDFEVEFSIPDEGKLQPPPDALPRAFRCFRTALERGVNLLADIDTRYWRTCTLIQEIKPGERYLDNSSTALKWLAGLFDRLVTEHPTEALREVQQWPGDDRFFFAQLKLYAWMKRDFVPASDVAAGLLALSPSTLWRGNHRRELLHVLKARWSEFSGRARARIEAKLLKGPPPFPGEDRASFRRRRAIDAATILGWLEKAGCELQHSTLERLPRLRATDPRWLPSWDAVADDSNESRVGWVRTDSDPSRIIRAPLKELLDSAEAHAARPFGEFTEYKPFEGVVQKHPFRAVAALGFDARHGRFRSKFWRIALSSWPKDARQRITLLLGRRIARLPADAVSELRFDIPHWLKEHLPDLSKRFEADALTIWDEVFGRFVELGRDATSSALGDTSIGGVVQERSRRTYDHAINSPVGQLAEIIFEMVNDAGLAAKAGIPDAFRTRLEWLLSAPGEGADHAVCECARRLKWLYFLDPQWTKERVLPLFDTKSPFAEPAWNGYLHESELPNAELFSLIKADFLQVFSIGREWRWDDDPFRLLNQLLVVATWWNQKSGAYVSYEEARAALQTSDDEGRSAAIWVLATIVRDHRAWRSFGRPFLTHAWPREARFRTPSVSRNLATLAVEAGARFPEVVRLILPLVGPVEHLDLILYKMKPDGSEEATPLASKYPDVMLALLDKVVPEDPRGAPYELPQVLEQIAAARPGLRQDQRWRRLAAIVRQR